MNREHFGTLADGREVSAFRLGTESGVSATVLNYGGRLISLRVPTATGRREVLLAPRDMAGTVADIAYMGAIAGRYANRIAQGRFTLDGRAYRVPPNNNGHALHGGPVGFDRAVWAAEADGEALVLRHVSADGDQGFPGRLETTVRYEPLPDGLAIDMLATTDAPTVLNLASHAYFNLAGGGDVLDHVLTLHADAFTPVDAGLIPTGEQRSVVGTPFDFRSPQRIGGRIGADDEQLRREPGFDHNFVLAERSRPHPEPAALLQVPDLSMTLLTTQPGVQLYTGNYLPEAGFPLHGALCLETQHFPDSPNRAQFPSTVLRPGEQFRARTVLQFAAG